jgi:two-component system chemotaxis sensor kinase CheA
MPEPDREFQQRLLTTFRGEAEEHVRAISGGLIDLENTPGVEERAPIVEKIFREAHSLKGAARAVDQQEIALVCQHPESVFSAMK